MAIRTGAEYLSGIQDDRQVWLNGARVEDVTTHPELAGFAQTLADVYDLQHAPEFADVLTMESPSSGDRVSLSYLVPKSLADLQRRRAMIELLARRSGGTLGRLPEYMSSIVVGLYDVRETLADTNPEYAENVANYLEFCRENDVAMTHSFADAPRDTQFSRDQFENLHVAEENEDGIIVHGVKSVASLAPFADEYLSLAPNRPGLDSSEIVYFAVPLATPGLRVHCRSSLSQPAGGDHRLAESYDEQDCWVVFDQVFVPRERVFYRQEAHVHLGLLNDVLPWAFHHILTRMACKAEALAGIASLISDYLGKDGQQHTQFQLCEVYAYVETLRAFLTAAEQAHVLTNAGNVIPNPTQITLGRIHSVEHHPRILQIIRELCGSGLLMAPTEAELASPEVADDVMRYLVGPDDRALDRFKLLKLAWEYTADSFGSRQLLFEMHNAGSSLTTKQRLAASYDAAPLKDLARRLAGIGTDPK
jgi:4-hydroxyphenylacetate 3-monooxygenase